MNNKLTEFKENIKRKKVAVLGMGISNTPLIRFLGELGVDVTAFDKAEEKDLEPVLRSLEGLPVKYCLGEDYLSKLTGFDVIFKTPVVRYDIPALVAAREQGAVVTSEMEVFFELCPARIFAVTGSDGKTTTTTLIYRILKEHGYRCWLGGNIGTPLLSRIDEIQSDDMVVLELSSFQLHTMQHSPQVAVVTNITPNHLDVHTSMDEYIEAKRNILRYQDKTCKAVLNHDNDLARSFGTDCAAQVTYFSRQRSIQQGAVLENGRLVYKTNGAVLDIVGADEIVIPGAHNIENYLAAIAATIEYVNPQDIARVATTFGGVEHRIEFVRELDGVKYYNSSIDSSPNRTIAAMNTFPQRIILIAGGKDKNIPYDDMGPVLVDKVKKLILIGPTADKIEQSLRDEVARTGKGRDIDIFRCSSYAEIVNTAREQAVPGDIVLLSPASTSFDMFKNFEERGNLYKALVKDII